MHTRPFLQRRRARAARPHSAPTGGSACAQPSQRIALTEKVVSAAGLPPSKAPPGKGGDGPPLGKPASVEVSKRFAVAVNMTFTGGPLPAGITAIGLPLSVDAVPPLRVEGVNFVGQVNVEALSAARAPTQCMYAYYARTHTHMCVCVCVCACACVCVCARARARAYRS
jgi:hypothetical protein